MKNLIIVFTPLQFLYALQFAKEFNKNTFKIVVLTDSIINIKQIRKIDRNDTASYPLEKLNFLESNILWLIKLIYVRFIAINKYQQVVVGNFNNIAGYYACIRFSEAKKNVVLLDDGLATFKIYTDRNINNRLYNTKLFGGRSVKVLKKIFQLNEKRKISSLTFYSLYDLVSLSKCKFDKVHNFILSEHKLKLDKNLVWFIGQPLVKYNILDKEAFVNEILKVKEFYQNRNMNFVYISHRFEEPFVDLDVDYQYFDLPLEDIFLNQQSNLPGTIISFYSTALLNINSLVPDIDSFYIDVNEFELRSKSNLSEIYSYFKSVIGLKEYFSK